MFTLGLSLSHTHEVWSVVRGRDMLLHWQCSVVDGRASNIVIEGDETTWCGQTFFDRTPLSPEGNPVTCIECAAGKPDA